MFNFLDKIKSSPATYRQLAVNAELITEFNCPLETDKQSMWSEQGYFAYVITGKKVWHVPGKSFELTEGKCIFVKKGAHIVEQFFDTQFCVVAFFVSEEFIADSIKGIGRNVSTEKEDHQIFVVDADDSLHAFFQSIAPYFLSTADVKKELLELKFRELILNVIQNPVNSVLTNYFFSIRSQPPTDSIRKVMEENFLYNLKLEDLARICGRSLSAFKRDFSEQFNTTPGRWLLERRLNHAQILISSTSKSISEVAFESGFENASHFSKTYRQLFGISPLEARKGVIAG